MHAIRKALTIAAVMVLAVLPATTALNPVVAEPDHYFGVAGGAAAPTLLRYYEGPCQKRVREARNIPLFNDARVAWERRHAGDAVAAEFHAALRACPQIAKWDWGSMVLSGTETLGR